jgi:hypothetical protein
MYQGWPAANDPQTPSVPGTKRPPGFGHPRPHPQAFLSRRPRRDDRPPGGKTAAGVGDRPRPSREARGNGTLNDEGQRDGLPGREDAGRVETRRPNQTREEVRTL